MKKLMVSLVMVVVISPIVHGYVYSDYTWYTYNGHQYALTLDVGNWDQMEAEAVAVGGHLATINDADENAWIALTFIPQLVQPDYNYLWNGLYQDHDHPDYSEPAGGWVWISGEPVAFLGWHGQEPTNHPPGEDYAFLAGIGGWSDWGPDRPDFHPIHGIIEISELPCEWVLLNGELNIPRTTLTGEALNGYVYAIGGTTPPHWPPYARADVSRYDPDTDSWSLVASMPTARHSLSSAVIDGWIYAVGGHVTNSRSENQRYNGTSWESKASVYARSGPGVAAYDGKLYVFGGNHSSTILSRFDIYDPTTDSWSYGGEMPAVAEPWRATTLDDKIYVYASGYVDLKKVWCYDPVAHTWDTSIPLMNVPRDSAELQVVNGRIYAIGGTNSSDGILSSVESWVPGETNWTMEPSLNVVRKTFASAVIGNNIYVFGGQNETGNLGSTEVLRICEPVGGWIAFASWQDGDADIWAVRPDGTGLRQLTNMPGSEFTPQWSPDSTRIAYDTGGDAQLWVYDWFTGSNNMIYESGQYSTGGPVWSPDGTKILFREEASYNNPHIAVINADGTGWQIVPVQSGYVSNPSWSPSGTAFVYEKRNSGASYSNDLWIYDFTASGNIMNGTNIRLTAGAGSESTTKISPDWRPGGDIVLSWGHNLVIINPGESPTWRVPPISDLSSPYVTILTDNASYPSLAYWGPSWSPDQSQIVYWYYHPGGGVDDLWIMDAAGGNRNPLTSTPYRAEWPDWGNPVCEPDPVELLISLAQDVIALNLQQGISNSLDVKLEAAMQALDDINENNDVAAINTLEAFMNAVEAQRGNKISEADADALIAKVLEIIDLLTAE